MAAPGAQATAAAASPAGERDEQVRRAAEEPEAEGPGGARREASTRGWSPQATPAAGRGLAANPTDG